jgi:guanylate kinase
MDSPETVERRLRNAPGELAQWREYDYLVLNDRLDLAVQRLIAIVDAERARVRRLKAAP